MKQEPKQEEEHKQKKMKRKRYNRDLNKKPEK